MGVPVLCFGQPSVFFVYIFTIGPGNAFKVFAPVIGVGKFGIDKAGGDSHGQGVMAFRTDIFFKHQG